MGLPLHLFLPLGLFLLPLVAPPPAEPPAKARSQATSAARPKPRPTPAPKPVLEGTVKGPDGKPVEKAVVRARPVLPRWSDFPRTTTTNTDAAGRFHLDLASREPHDVQVDAKGLAPARLEKVAPGTPLAINLGRGRTIEGVVRDEAGQGVPGARVVARADRGLVASIWDEGVSSEAVTDGAGRFRLEGIAPGLHAVEATARGYGRGSRRNVRPGASVTVTLRVGGWIRGTVSDPEGRPVPGAQVRAEFEPRFQGQSRLEATDAKGRFDLVGLSGGQYTLVAHHPDFPPAIVSGVALESDGGSEADLVFAGGTSLLGRLLDGEGHPVKGRVQTQALDERPLPWSVTELLRTESGEDGRFRMARVGPGSWTLAVLARGFAGQRVEAEVWGREATVDLGDIVLERGLSMRGRVRTAAGAPVAGARINAYPEDIMTGGTFAETESEEDGAFVLGGLSPSPYNLSVQATGFASLTQPVPPGADNVEVVLSPGGTLTGVVVEEGDRPVDSYQIRGSPEAASRMHMGDLFKSVGSPDGRFLFEDVAEGTYVLQVAAPDRAPASVSGVKVVAGRTTDAGAIRLPRGGVVRGSVVEAGGAAIPGAAVKVFGPGSDVTQWMDLLATTTDQAGGFEIRGVPAGNATVIGTHPEFAAGESAVTVDPARGPSDVRLTLFRGGRIEGWARRRDGTPLSGHRVHGMAQGARSPFGSGSPSTTVRPDGSFALEHVPPGTVSLTLMTEAGPGHMISALSREVEVREGETTTVEFVSREILVIGRVTRSGSPLPGIDLRLWSMSGTSMRLYGGYVNAVPAKPSGPERMHAVSGEDGSFELIVDEPGQYWVQAQSQAGRVSYPGRALEVPDADTHVVELSYSGVPVSGLVVDKETEQPVARAMVTARRKPPTAEGGTAGQTLADGRFSFELEPGDYLFAASAEEYAEARSEASVGAAGLSDLRFELGRGKPLAGRIVDAAGRGVSGLSIMAVDEEIENPLFAQTLADGSFRFGGVAERPYNVCSGNEQAGYAVRVGLMPGSRDVTIPLRPAGRVRLLVRGPDGAPVAKARPSVTKVGGAKVYVPDMGLRGTNAAGMVEVPTPPGNLEITVRGEKLKATLRLSVAEGAAVDAEATLNEPLEEP